MKGTWLKTAIWFGHTHVHTLSRACGYESKISSSAVNIEVKDSTLQKGVLQTLPV